MNETVLVMTLFAITGGLGLTIGLIFGMLRKGAQ
jgi:hypothetical protein